MAEETFHAEVIGWCRNGGVAAMTCLPEGTGLSKKLCGVESVETKSSSQELRTPLRETADDKDHGSRAHIQFGVRILSSVIERSAGSSGQGKAGTSTPQNKHLSVTVGK